MRKKALSTAMIVFGFTFNGALFATPASVDKAKEFLKITGTEEIVKFAASNQAKQEVKNDPSKKLKKLRSEKEMLFTQAALEQITDVYTDEELDTVIAMLKTDAGKLFVKRSIEIQKKRMETMNRPLPAPTKAN